MTIAPSDRRPATPAASPGEDARWRAVLTRDRAFDGVVWYGVRTTGIYCRPSCPSRTPRVENVSFHESPAAAEGAGFRACRRCRPDAADMADPGPVTLRRSRSDALPRTPSRPPRAR